MSAGIARPAPITMVITSLDVKRCPKRSMSPRHYRPDGSCLCDVAQERRAAAAQLRVAAKALRAQAAELMKAARAMECGL